MRFEPQRASSRAWVNPSLPPPRPFIAIPVHFAMMSAAQRDNELITDFAPQSPALGKAQMMGIGGTSTANQTSLGGHISDVVAVPNATRLRQRQRAFIHPF
jgi:hypothetical protein